MNSQPPPPQLPAGWIAMWDQATGKTQWEAPGCVKSEESNNYGYQQHLGNQAAAPSTQQPYAASNTSDETQHKGINKVYAGVGGVVAGGLIGLAAGKLFSHHESHKKSNSYQEGSYHSSGHEQGGFGGQHGSFDRQGEHGGFGGPGRHGNEHHGHHGF